MSTLFSVTEAASDRSLLTTAELRAAIGNATAPDGDVETLGRRVSSVIVSACRVAVAGATPPTLRLETLSDTYRLKSTQCELILSRRPVVEISSVVEDGTTLDADDYEVDASAGIIKRLSSDCETYWPCGKIVIAYRAGWETVPDDLKEAAAKLAATLWSEGSKGDPGLKRESIPGVLDREWWVGPSDDPAIPQEVKDLLGPYMNHWIG